MAYWTGEFAMSSFDGLFTIQGAEMGWRSVSSLFVMCFKFEGSEMQTFMNILGSFLYVPAGPTLWLSVEKGWFHT